MSECIFDGDAKVARFCDRGACIEGVRPTNA